VPGLTPAQRCQKFAQLSDHFIEDISAERLAVALSNLGDAQDWVERFSRHVQQTANPRAAILLRATKKALADKHRGPQSGDPVIDFTWSDKAEEDYNQQRVIKDPAKSIAFEILYWPYLIWRFFFRSKNTSRFRVAFSQYFFKRLSDETISDEAWLETFERYSRLFKLPVDILLMAEALTFRLPARRLALLGFTYRVRVKKPKVLLFLRRTLLALTQQLSHNVPEYRGAELTQIFYNPLADKREKARNKIQAAREKKLERNRIKRESLQLKAKKNAEATAAKRRREREKRTAKAQRRRETILNARETQRATQKAKNLRQKEKVLKARTDARAKQQSAQKAGRLRQSKRALRARSIGQLSMRTTKFWTRFTGSSELEAYNPVQLSLRSTDKDGDCLQYMPMRRRQLRANPDMAIISVTGRFDPLLDMSDLGSFSRLIVLNITSMTDTELKNTLQDYVGEDVVIECFSASNLLIRPYTAEHQGVSDYADSLSRHLTAHIFKHDAISKYFETELTQEYALTLSDNIFRSIERFSAAHLFFETIPRSTPVFFSSVQDPFSFTLAKLGFSNIVILGGGARLGQMRAITPHYEHAHPREWLKIFSKAAKDTERRIFKWMPRPHVSSQPKAPKLLMALHSRSSIHKASAEKIQDHLSNDYDIDVMDLAPNAKASEGRENFYQIARSMERTITAKLRKALLPLISETLATHPLKSFDTQELTSELATIMARNTGTLLAQTSLYRAVKETYAAQENCAALLIPGRYADIRAIARAFHTLNFPTLDIQLLFLSTMARYRAPIATHHTVIDKTARQFYAAQFQIDADKIGVIGSILRDDEINKARDFGKAASLEALGFDASATAITLACQPGFEQASYDAAEVLAAYVAARPDINICVKLHPGQKDSHLNKMTEIFVRHAPKAASRWTIIHKAPFWRVMPATDILMSYFSNVCLQACAFGTPVLSLPGGDIRPEPDFEAIGLAENIRDINALIPRLDTLIAMSPHERQKQPPLSYLQDNPHMANTDALKRLEAYVATLF